MKKLILIACFITGILHLGYSQTDSIANSTSSENVTKRTFKMPYQQSSLYDGEWIVGIGAGAQVWYTDHAKQQDQYGERIVPTFEIMVGKWFYNDIGLRLSGGGFKHKGLRYDEPFSTGERYTGPTRNTLEPGRSLYHTEFNYFRLTADVMYNIMNSYGEDFEHKYVIAPYVGVGWMHTNYDATFARRNNVQMNIGLHSSAKIYKGLSLTFDFRALVVDDSFDGTLGESVYDGALSASLGLQYSFLKKQ